MEKGRKEKTYEPPRIDIIEFQFEESIASSLDHGPNLSCGEEIFGHGGGGE